MATYSTIKGFTIQSLASDPYVSEVLAGTWASSNNLGTAIYGAGSAGTQTAGLAIGGSSAPPAASNRITTTQEYDGTSWANGGALAVARFYGVSAGTQTAALFAGGNYDASPVDYAVTEEYDGTSWTAGNSLQTASTARASAGTQTAAFGCGGRAAPDAYESLMETYDGTTWTEVNNLNTGVSNQMGAGTTTAGLSFGGLVSDPSATGNTNATEEWDGTCWATVNTMNTSNRNRGSSGTQTAALGFGGKGPPSNTLVAVTEAYDGTTWTEVADLATARSGGSSGKSGSQTSTFYAGGALVPAFTNVTEEFTAPSTVMVAQEGQVWYNTTSTVLKGFGQFLASGTWASGAGMAAYANGIRGFGTQTAAVGVGFYGPSTPLSYTYNGTAWSSINGLVNAPGRYYPGGTGTTTAGICFGGEPGKNESETYDGTSWTEGNNLTTGRNFMASGGTSTAAFGAAGYAPGYTGKTEIWNGTSWSEDADVPVGVQGPGGNGSVTAAIIYSGIIASPSTTTAITYTFDGTTWSDASADVNTECSMFGSAGPQTGNTAALKFGGETHPGKTVNTELYDGSTWTEVANIANGRRSFGGAGTTASALFFGGEPPSGAGLTEEWSVTPSIKTFTAS